MVLFKYNAKVTILLLFSKFFSNFFSEKNSGRDYLGQIIMR